MAADPYIRQQIKAIQDAHRDMRAKIDALRAEAGLRWARVPVGGGSPAAAKVLVKILGAYWPPAATAPLPRYYKGRLLILSGFTLTAAQVQNGPSLSAMEGMTDGPECYIYNTLDLANSTPHMLQSSTGPYPATVAGEFDGKPFCIIAALRVVACVNANLA